MLFKGSFPGKFAPQPFGYQRRDLDTFKCSPPSAEASSAYWNEKLKVEALLTYRNNGSCASGSSSKKLNADIAIAADGHPVAAIVRLPTHESNVRVVDHARDRDSRRTREVAVGTIG